MKPPICEVCNDRFDPDDGRLLRFLGDERSTAWRAATEADGRVGHPPDTGWFCGEHAPGAAALAQTATLGQALAALRPAPAPARPDPPAETERRATSTPPPSRPAPDRSFLPDDYRRVEISPLSVDALTTRLERFFDDLIAGFSTATGITPNRDDDEVRRTAEQLASPEWREKGPASEEVEITIAVRLGAWECRFTRSRHDWLHGGLIQSSATVAVVDLDESATNVVLRVGGGAHAGSPVAVVSGYGQRPEFAAALLDALLAELLA